MRLAGYLVSFAVAVSVTACGDNLEGNRAPDIEGQSVQTPEDTPVSITVDAVDPDGDALAFSYSDPEHGTVTGTGASISYRPDDDYNGPDAITVTVSDGTDDATATLSITVAPLDDAPIAGDDALAANEDEVVTVSDTVLLANDSDPDGDALSLTAVANPVNGTVALAAGTITFTPTANFTGAASFEYTLTAGTGSDTGLVTITVGGGNDPPVATADTATTAEDTVATIATTALTANDTDPEGQSLSVTAVSAPTGGTVDLAGGTVTFTPTLDFNGSGGFDYTVSDGAATATGHVTVTVTPVNDAPVATAGTATTDEDAAVTITLAGSDVDGDALTFAVATGPTAGTLGAITQLTPTTASVTYTPAANSSADDSFTFTVADASATSAPATVAIDVVPQNDTPVATPGAATVNEDDSVTITLAGTDGDGDALTFAIATAPTAGALGTITPLTANTASVTYTPTAGSTADDAFTFTVADATVTSAPATVTIDVVAQNDAPVATPGAATTDEDTAVVLTLVGADGDGDPLTFAVVTGPGAGTLGTITQLSPISANVTYTPAANSAVDDSFTFRVNDGNGDSAPATFTIDVVPVNDPPVAVDDTDSVERDTAMVRASTVYTANDTDLDGPGLSVTAVGNAVNGTVLLVAGSITFTPTAGYTGPASFEYTLSDGGPVTDTGLVAVTVIETNTAVQAIDDLDTATEDVALVRQTSVYLANDIDPDPQTLVVTSVQDAVNGTVDLTGTTITFTPTAEYSGPASFTYTVTDGLANDTAVVTITVLPVNDAPVANDDPATVAEDGSVIVDVLANDTNDNGALTIDSFTQGASGTVTQVGSSLQYAPAANFNGTDTFTYVAADAGALTDGATVTVTVTPVNDAPVAASQTLSFPENAPATITLSATDLDVPAVQLTFAIATPPANGTLGAITPLTLTTASVTYTPNADYVGPDGFTFTASDGTDTSAPAAIVLTLTNVVVCGDGQIEGTETCDDNGIIADDGCSATCQEETGWDCTGAPSSCDTVCGDGFTVAGHEECDDNNGVDTDGCTTQCQRGVVCAAGNTELTGGDRFATDPGNGTCYVSFDDDAATFSAAQASCVAISGHLATITSTGEQGIVASVHNPLQNPWIGLTDELVEGSFGWITGEAMTFNGFATGQPDGGDSEDCVALFSAAIAPAGETSRWNDTNCNFTGFVQGRICEIALPTCGDGIVQPVAEQCDDGNTNDSDGCSATCTVEAGAVCSGTAPTTCAKLVINEIDYDNVGTDNAEYVEIYNAGTATADLTNHAIVLVSANASPATQYGRVNLSGTLAAGAYALVCPANSAAGQCGPHTLTAGTTRFLFTASVDQVQNGAPDALGLFVISGTTATAVDVLSYEGNTPTGQITGITGTSVFTEGTGVVTGEDNATAISLQRRPNGRDTQNNNVDFALRAPTPGAPSVP